MAFLYLLEKIRIPVLNEFMLTITTLGEETAFLVAALIVFWCVDKRKGYYVLGVGLVGSLASQFMKILCRIPRPWVWDPDFTVLEEAKAAAGGYSFPSGHTQSAVGTFGAIAASVKKRAVRIVCIVLAVMVGVSRMYAGVHTPEDVIVGALISLILIFALRPLILGKGERFVPWVFGGLLALSAAYVVWLEAWSFPADLDAENYASAVKNAYTFLGCFAALPVVYLADETKLHFSTKAVWWAQILKTLGGLVMVLLVKEGLRSPLEALFAGHLAARAVRYFLVVLVAGILWPLSFRWFGKLGKREA